MDASVAQIIKIMENLAPPWLAEDWDNAGLQIGNLQLPARRIWIALDPGPEVIETACKSKVDLLITHHPLIFKPLKSIDFNTPGGSIIQKAAQHNLAIYSAHTNLDIVNDGVNDILAQRLELKDLEILQAVRVETPGEVETDPPVDSKTEYGIGRIGVLKKTSSLNSLAALVKSRLGLDFVKVAGDPEMKISRVAICSGSGSGLMQAFLSSEADVYISGDIHYHDARDAEYVQRAVIDIGHFASEHLMVEALADRLNQSSKEAGFSAEITACLSEKDPFIIT